MKVKKINNSSEWITFNEILKELTNTNYLIFPKLAMKEVIDDCVKTLLSGKEKNYLNSSHFDFVIVDKNHSPVFAVEFDGPHHQLYEKKKISDLKKNKICQLAELPLLRITDSELFKVESLSVLQFIIYRFVKFNENFEEIKERIAQKISEMDEESVRRLTLDGYLDPAYDPQFIFHIEHPFPFRDAIIKKLKTQYNLTSTYNNINTLWYQVFSKGSTSDTTYTDSYYYGIYKGKSKDGNFSWKSGKIDSKDIEVLEEDETHFSMKWELVTDSKYDQKISPVSFFMNTGKLPIYFADLPGAQIPDICDSIAEYLAYKKVLHWAESNL